GTLRSFSASSVAAGEVYGFAKDWGGFNKPHALDVDSSGKVYVLDTDNNRVQVFDADGNFITQWGSLGSSPGQFNAPQGISVRESSGNVYVYVVDTGNNRVEKFTLTGVDILLLGLKWS